MVAGAGKWWQVQSAQQRDAFVSLCDLRVNLEQIDGLVEILVLHKSLCIL